MIHLHLKACDGPFLTLFQRNLLLAYREIQPDVADMVMKYYLDHAGQWLDPQNVALSVYSEVPPYPIEAVKVSSSMPLSIDVNNLLMNRNAGLKQFFTYLRS